MSTPTPTAQSTNTATSTDATREALRRRLKSIEGQARGIQRMLDEGRDCHEIMDQLAALSAASHAAGLQAFQAFALQCLQTAGRSPEGIVTQLTRIVTKLAR
jgi:CsoR family transcriptional regulator, copper-sensing transcriptional repressor